MNTIDIALTPDYSALADNILYLQCDLTIDQRPVLHGNEDDIDLYELFLSLNGDWHYFIFTCACGCAECGGYYHGVNVTTNDLVVEWADEDFGRHYVFDASHVKDKLHQAKDDLLRWMRSAETMGLELNVWPDNRTVGDMLQLLTNTWLVQD